MGLVMPYFLNEFGQRQDWSAEKAQGRESSLHYDSHVYYVGSALQQLILTG